MALFLDKNEEWEKNTKRSQNAPLTSPVKKFTVFENFQ
jgi:hypothetical protein